MQLVQQKQLELSASELLQLRAWGGAQAAERGWSELVARVIDGGGGPSSGSASGASSPGVINFSVDDRDAHWTAQPHVDLRTRLAIAEQEEADFWRCVGWLLCPCEPLEGLLCPTSTAFWRSPPAAGRAAVDHGLLNRSNATAVGQWLQQADDGAAQQEHQDRLAREERRDEVDHARSRAVQTRSQLPAPRRADPRVDHARSRAVQTRSQLRNGCRAVLARARTACRAVSETTGHALSCLGDAAALFFVLLARAWPCCCCLLLVWARASRSFELCWGSAEANHMLEARAEARAECLHSFWPQYDIAPKALFLDELAYLTGSDCAEGTAAEALKKCAPMKYLVRNESFLMRRKAVGEDDAESEDEEGDGTEAVAFNGNYLGADIAGCGLHGCAALYKYDSIEACRDACEKEGLCKSFGFLPENGDQPPTPQCLLYDSDEPTQRWRWPGGDGQYHLLFCKMKPECAIDKGTTKKVHK
eukprot:g7587.t1